MAKVVIIDTHHGLYRLLEIVLSFLSIPLLEPYPGTLIVFQLAANLCLSCSHLLF